MTSPTGSEFNAPTRATKDEGAPFTHGAFSQFFKKDRAAYEVLRGYRSVNPSNPVHLVSDGGDDMSDLAEIFHCDFVHERLRTHRWASQYVWLQRVNRACLTTFAEVDWILVLESDVECFRSPVHLPRYPLSGGPTGCPWTPALQKFFAQKWGPRFREGGLGSRFRGCGGSIFNRRAFVESFANTDYHAFEQGCLLDYRIAFAEDAALTYVLHADGHDSGPWEELARSDDPGKHRCAFAHADKRYYNKPYPLHPNVVVASSGVENCV